VAETGDDFAPGGVLGVPHSEAEAVSDLWRDLGWRVARADDMGAPPHVALLRIETP